MGFCLCQQEVQVVSAECGNGRLNLEYLLTVEIGILAVGVVITVIVLVDALLAAEGGHNPSLLHAAHILAWV